MKRILTTILCVLTSVSAGLADVTEGLRLRYTFDSNAGATTADAAGDGLDGIVHGATWVPRGAGGAYQFDGQDDWIEIPGSDRLSVTQNFTLAAWVYMAQPVVGGILTRSGIPNNSLRDIDWYVEPTESKFCAYFWGQGWGERFFSGETARGSLVTGQWYHVVLQHDRSLSQRQMRWYVNGQLREMFNRYETVSSVETVRLSGAPWRIGGFTPGSHMFNGMIDDVRIYDRVLTEQEVLAVYRAQDAEPILHYTFDSNSGATTADASGGGHDGVIRGATWVARGAGGAYRFDGQNDWIDVSGSEGLNITQDFTLSAWIYMDQLQTGGILTRSNGNPDNNHRDIDWCTSGSDAKVVGYFWDEAPGERFFSGETAHGSLTTGRWYHVVMQQDASMSGHEMRMYMDGQLAQIFHTYETVSSVPSVRVSGAPWRVGALGLYNHYFNGLIDNVRIYDRVLTADQVQLLYRQERDPDLVLHYTFDNDGAQVMDFSGHGLNGTRNGTGCTYAPGFLGKALRLENASSVTAPMSPLLSLGAADDKTFSIWWRADSVAGSLPLISKRGVENGNLGLSFDTEHDGANYYTHTCVDHWIKHFTTMKSNTWYHTVLTKQGNVWHTYHNGQELTSVHPGTGGYYGEEMGWPYLADVEVPVPLMFGHDQVIDIDFKGYLDDIRVYRRALSSNEVAELYAMSLNQLPGELPEETPAECEARLRTNLVLRYGFDNDGADVVDQSGNGLNGTRNGSGCEYRPGRVGQAIYLRNASSVTAPLSPRLTLGAADDKTFSMWWRADSVAGSLPLISKRAAGNNNLGLSFDTEHDGANYYTHTCVDHWIKHFTTMMSNTWYHAVLTKQGSIWRVYHNGQELSPVHPGTGGYFGEQMGWPYQADIEVPVPLMFGHDQVIDIDFKGLLDEIRVYNCAMTSDEVAGLHNYYLSLPSDPGGTGQVSIATNRVWIVQPREGEHVQGDVTVNVNVAPANDVARVVLESRFAGDGVWSAVGAPIVPPPSSFLFAWSTTGLVDGASYELRATVTTGAGVVTSAVRTVCVDARRSRFAGTLPADRGADTDADGMADWNEMVAGTDPADTEECLVTRLKKGDGEGLLVEWDSVAGRVYTLYGSEKMDGASVQLLQTNGTDGVQSYALGGTNTLRYFRVHVSMP